MHEPAFSPLDVERELRRIGVDLKRLTGLAGRGVKPADFVNWLRTVPGASATRRSWLDSRPPPRRVAHIRRVRTSHPLRTRLRTAIAKSRNGRPSCKSSNGWCLGPRGLKGRRVLVSTLRTALRTHSPSYAHFLTALGQRHSSRL